MNYFKQYFMYNPGGENETGNSTPAKNEQNEGGAKSTDEGYTDKDKPFLKKIKDALQEWSNEDQAEQDFDDTRV
jgi:hypothetical protein